MISLFHHYLNIRNINDYQSILSSEVFKVNVLNCTRSSYFQNVIKNIILTKYSNKAYLVASRGGHVVGIQMLSCEKLKYKVNQPVGGYIISYQSSK